mmetsp:Transcript_89439/g.251894  ORF Transcript_89439/g.251894 Transcript_89439/m.251894 type:complete len:426 (+) Transcript_89439:142-1419(+)
MSKKNTGEISATVEETNKIRASLGLRPLAEGASKDVAGSSKNPLDANAEKGKVVQPSESDVKRRSAAAKNKKDHEDLTTGEGLADILAREEGAGGAADWIARTRNKDGTMKGAAAAASSATEKSKRKSKGEAAEVPAIRVRHDQSDLAEGNEVTMVLSDKPILNKDGEVDDSRDELSNVRLVDNERAKHNDAVRNQVEYDPNKEGQDILEKYNELQTGPKGFMIGGSTIGVIEETDPEKRLAILTALSDKHSLEGKLKVQSDFYTSEEMSKMMTARKPPKKRTKRKRDEKANEKEDQIGGSLPMGSAVAGRPADAGSDEEDPELYEQLSKQRRLVRRSDAGTVKKGEAALGAVSERIATLEGDPEKAEEAAAKQHGVRLNQSVALGVRALARQLGCEAHVPAVIRGLPEGASAPKHPHAVPAGKT